MRESTRASQASLSQASGCCSLLVGEEIARQSEGKTRPGAAREFDAPLDCSLVLPKAGGRRFYSSAKPGGFARERLNALSLPTAAIEKKKSRELPRASRTSYLEGALP